MSACSCNSTSTMPFHAISSFVSSNPNHKASPVPPLGITAQYTPPTPADDWGFPHSPNSSHWHYSYQHSAANSDSYSVENSVCDSTSQIQFSSLHSLTICHSPDLSPSTAHSQYSNSTIFPRHPASSPRRPLGRDPIFLYYFDRTSTIDPGTCSLYNLSYLPC